MNFVYFLVSKLPTIETIENCMKLSPMLIQGLWEFKSPLLQLPHLTEDNLKYFVNKKRYIKSLQQFAKLTSEESRSLLRDLTDFEYNNVVKVLGKMPLIDFNIRCEVVDDENSNVVTAGAIVTVTVSLVRRNMKELFGDTTAVEKETIIDDEKDGGGEEKEATLGNGEVKDGTAALTTAAADDAASKAKKPVWLKQKAHKSKGKSKPKSKPALTLKTSVGATGAVVKDPKEPKAVKENDSDADESSAESDDENVVDRKEPEDRSSEPEDEEKKTSSLEDDDMEWEKFQQKLNKREKLEGRSKMSHSVHSPAFPEVIKFDCTYYIRFIY